jgi:hypothetical protein
MTERLRGQIARDHLLKAATDSERMASDAEQREIEYRNSPQAGNSRAGPAGQNEPSGDIAGLCQHSKSFTGQVGALRPLEQATWFAM